MTQKHYYAIGIDDYGDVYDIVIRDNDTIIAVLSSGEGPAQHLVRAGNCLDELLAALKNARQEIQAWRSGLNTRKGYKNLHEAKVGACFVPLSIVDEAIAKAEGRKS